MDNNEARRQFKTFVSTWGLEVSGRRNVFVDDGKRWAYVADNQATTCRQFYEDCAGVYFNDNFISKDKLQIRGVSRVSPAGLKAYNVILPTNA